MLLKFLELAIDYFQVQSDVQYHLNFLLKAAAHHRLCILLYLF